jgi:hypothetical protein
VAGAARWWVDAPKGGVVANPGFARWCLVPLLLAMGCTGEGADPTTTPVVPTSSTTVASTTSTVPPTTASTSMPAGPADGPTLLVAHPGGIDLWAPPVVTPLLTGRPVEVAVPDLRGGVVFQGPTPETDSWPPPAVPIEHLVAPGSDPVVLVEGEGSYLQTLVQVAEIEGRPTVVYRRWVEDPNDCGDDPPECRWRYVHEDLVLRDLASGTERNLGIIGEFESSWVEVRFGGETAVVAIEFYADEGACTGWFPTELLVDRTGGGWIGAGGLLGELCTTGPTPTCPEGSRCSGSVEIAITPDGSLIAQVVAEVQSDDATGNAEPFPPLLTVRAPDGPPRLAVEVAGPGTYPESVDVTDGWVLVEVRIAEASLAYRLVDESGTVHSLDVDGRPCFWHEG